MCGHVGVAGYIGKDETRAFHQLLWLDAIRGRDNTGAVSVGQDDEVRVSKVVGDTSVIFDSKTYENTTVLGRKLIIGHNRAKTIGGNDRKNAHPFVFDEIVGAHNGSLGWASYSKFDGYREYDTDSQGLFGHINDHGIDATLDLITCAQDAYALVWYHFTSNALNFLRNDERPFFYAFTDDGKTLFWASEKGMLYLALNRNGIKFSTVYGLKPDVHVTMVIPDAGKAFGKPITAVKKRKLPPLTVFSSGYSSEDGWFNRGGKGVKRYKSGDTQRSKGNRIVGRVTSLLPCDLEQYKDLFDKGKLDLTRLTFDPHANEQCYYWGKKNYYQEEWELYTSTGCFNCGKNPTWGEPIKFLKEEQFVCAPCLIRNKGDVIGAVTAFL